jgi:excisionase family DNA binding protein
VTHPAQTESERSLTIQVPETLLAALVELVEARVVERLSDAGIAHFSRRPEYLTPVEAAELLRCSRQRVYDLLSSGRLRRYKDGSRVLVARLEIVAYLSGQQVAPGLPPARPSRFRKGVDD